MAGASEVRNGIDRFLFRRKREMEKLGDFLHGCRIRWEQRCAARRYGLKRRTRDVIVFFTPTADRCNGGIMSIATLAAESRRLNPDAAVICSFYPGVLRYERCRNETFPNEEILIPFDWVCRHTSPGHVILHVPDYASSRFHTLFSDAQLRWLKAVPSVQVNILNQNIRLMPPPEALDGLRRLGGTLTQTTAHDRYATQETCDRYGMPLHHFSTYADHAGWPNVRFAQKDKVIVVSPDKNPRRDEVLEMVARRLPDYRVVEVRNLTFMQYLQLASQSLFSLTFGEGFDGYLVQPPYCGSLCFAVYNDEFFPDRDWLSCENVYASYDDLLERLADDIRRLENDEPSYERICAEMRAKTDRLYGHEVFSDNLRRFYEGKYDFLPKGGAA